MLKENIKIVNMKKIIKITREDLEKIITECIMEESKLQIPLMEGIDIDTKNHIVRFNPTHQDNVDTNDYINPYIIQNRYANCNIVSMFERKDNGKRTDGNPLVCALKGLYGWKFANPSYDIPMLYRRFLSGISCIQHNFDTMIMTPSHNEFNIAVFSRLRNYIHCDNYYETFFKKLPASTVKQFYLKDNILQTANLGKGIITNEKQKALELAFERMEAENGGIFSYKYLPDVSYRQGILQSMTISFGEHNLEEYKNAINGKDVIVLDDTVTSGKTISDSAEAILEMFAPKQITFLTVFSPRKRENVFKNQRYTTYR